MRTVHGEDVVEAVRLAESDSSRSASASPTTSKKRLRRVLCVCVTTAIELTDIAGTNLSEPHSR